MSKSAMFRTLAVATLSLGSVGAANALSIIGGDFVMVIKNYDAGTTGYQPLPGAPYPSVAVICNTVADCDTSATSPAPGSGASGIDTMGIFSIESIRQISTNTQWFQSGGADGFLTGVFTGLKDNNVTALCVTATNCTLTTTSLGGTFALYRNALDFNPALSPIGAGVNLPAGVYPGITDTGSLYLSGVFTPGHTVGDLTTTYTSTFNAFSFAGAGQGFLDLTGGSALAQYNTNALTDANGVKRDLFFDVTFNDVNGQASSIGWTVTSAGQIKGNVIPEPGSMALVALGLLGAGAFARRRS